MKESFDTYLERLKEVWKSAKGASEKGYDILLEYSDKPSPYYMPIGFTDDKTYRIFRKYVDSKIEIEKSLDNILNLYNEFYG